MRVFLFCFLGLLLSPETSVASSLIQIEEYTTKPTSLEMHLYVPESATSNPPVLVAVHYCAGSGPAFHQGSQFSKLADQYGFIVLYPSATREGRCFDVASHRALTRDGGSDPEAIIEMLNYVLHKYQADASKVYVAGVSSGAMMANVLLALYPEVFKAGAAYAGVPFTCFATEEKSGWNNKCSSGEVKKSAEAWGDIVRTANPDYKGPWPRVQLWHGSEDEALNFVNFNEEIKQWTNVHGLDENHVIIDAPTPNTTRRRYVSDSGMVVVEAISLQGVSHDLPIDGSEAIRFFGLDSSGPSITWRPFSADSPWNQRISADTRLDPNSAELVADFASRGPLLVNIKEWSIPVYYVDSENTPKHDVGDLRTGVYGAGFEPPRSVPIPEGAVASLPAGGDEHLAVIDVARGLEWGMWHTRQKDGRWMTGLGAVSDLQGTGVVPPWNEASRELDSHRARASGFPLIAGLIRVDEIRAGYIPHALVFAYDMVRTEHFIPPASTAQASTKTTRSNHEGMPMGARIYLDGSFDVAASSLSPAGKIIARALQDYGAYLGDFAGANVLYAESSPSALESWEGLLTKEDLVQVFTPQMISRYFRLVDMGEVRKGQNFQD